MSRHQAGNVAPNGYIQTAAGTLWARGIISRSNAYWEHNFYGNARRGRLGGDEAAEVLAFSAREGAATVLSRREQEVASLAARGHSNLEIAREFAISHKTVEKHLASVFLKLGISSRRELRHYAER